MIVEVKARKNGAGFKTLKRWMGSADALIMHEDHEESLVAIALPLFIDLILNHSQYKKPYEQIIKDKKKNMTKAREAWASSKEEIYKKKREAFKKSKQKIQQEKI